MGIQLGDIAPDFTQDSTAGMIQFHEFLGNSWGVLFSHPKAFTPVCTTELGAVAKLKAEFDKRGVKVIGALQLTANYKVATPVNWKKGQDCIVLPALSDEEATKLFPRGFKKIKPYLRTTPQPNL